MLDRTHAIAGEIRATLAIAGPLAAANLALMAMSLTDTVMVGRLGGAALAAGGLGALLYFTAVFVLQGVVSAVSPLCAYALGAGDRPAVGRIAGQGLALALLIAVPFALAVANLHHVLLALGYDAALAHAIGGFLKAVAWGSPALLGFAVLRGVLAALSRTRAVMGVLVCCVPVNAALDWVLIYGHFGAPPLGVPGAGLGSAIVAWLMVIPLVLYIQAIPALAGLEIWRRARSLHRSDLWSIIRLGAPIGGHLAFETGVFVAAGIILGLIGADALAANQIVLNFSSITYMVPVALGQAATVRCALELGAARPDAARRAGLVALGMGAAFMALTAALMIAAPTSIIAVYIDAHDPNNVGVIEIALRLMLIAALFQVFDGLQAVAAGALRGYKDTARPMLLAGLGYWVVGFVGGCALAFPLRQGAVGLWWGLALGTVAVAVLLNARFARLSGVLKIV